MDLKLYSYMVILFAAAAFFYCFVVLCQRMAQVIRLKNTYDAEGEMGQYIKKQMGKCFLLLAVEFVLAAVAVYFKVKF